MPGREERAGETFRKMLVRYNPVGDRALKRRQAGRLTPLSAAPAERGRSRFQDRREVVGLPVAAEPLELDWPGRHQELEHESGASRCWTSTGAGWPRSRTGDPRCASP